MIVANNKGMKQRALKRAKCEVVEPNAKRPKVKFTKFCYEKQTCNIEFDVGEVLDGVKGVSAFEHQKHTRGL